MRPVEFGILGPLQVLAGERPVVLGAAKLRATLAVLLVHANQFTSLDRLVDELWEDRPPSSAAKLVPQYVSPSFADRCSPIGIAGAVPGRCSRPDREATSCTSRAMRWMPTASG